MLMSLDTSTTSRGACLLSRRAWTTPRIWLSALPCGRLAGRVLSSGLVWKNSLPPASRWPVVSSFRPLGDVRALRAGQGVERAAGLAARCGRLPSCPSCGRRVLPARSSAGRCRVPRSGTGTSGRACSTLVSSTNSLAGPVDLALAGGPRRGLGLGCTRASCAARRFRRCRGMAVVASRKRFRMTARRRRRAGSKVQGLGLVQPAGYRPGPPPIFATPLCEERAGAS